MSQQSLKTVGSASSHSTSKVATRFSSNTTDPCLAIGRLYRSPRITSTDTNTSLVLHQCSHQCSLHWPQPAQTKQDIVRTTTQQHQWRSLIYGRFLQLSAFHNPTMFTLTQILYPLRRPSIPICTSPYLHMPVHIIICLCRLELSRSRHPLHYLEFKTRNRIKRKSDRLNVAHQIPWPVLQPKHVDRQPYTCVELHTKLSTTTYNALALVHSLRFHTVLKKFSSFAEPTWPP